MNTHLPECSIHQFIRPDETVFNAWTYGGLLLSSMYQFHDLDLRRVVAQCMGKILASTKKTQPAIADGVVLLAHRPIDRPSMVELEAIILAKIGSNWEALEPEPHSKTAIRDTFDEPTL